MLRPFQEGPRWAKRTGHANFRSMSATPQAILPPHVVRRDVFDAATVEGLLAYAQANEAGFVSSTVGAGVNQRLAGTVRSSLTLIDLGPWIGSVKPRLKALAAEAEEELRLSRFDLANLEFSLVAHNDGAFYARHIDTRTAPGSETLRVLSAIFYFHVLPKGFSGGALRLYGLNAPGAAPVSVDIEPENNSAVFFPSWVPHEVMPVQCPSHRFGDSRFAINCWFHKAR